MRSALAIAAVLMFTAHAAHADDTEKTEKRRSYVHAAWTFAGIGAVAVGTSIGLGLYANREYDRSFDNGNCIKDGGPPLCNPVGYADTKRAHTIGDVATVSGLVGIGLLAAAGIVYWQAPRDRISVAPTLTHESGGFVVRGSF